MDNIANEMLIILENHGFPSYKVGGCIRDQLLGLQVKDIDIATAAKPEQVMEIFPKSIPTGIQHGTLTIPYKGDLFEVTTFRIDKEYKDHRHPSGVEFVDRIEQDLSRRDFTINAMAMDRSGNIIDPYGGGKDLQNKMIRAVGDPYQRFEEDPLRVLRGIRFSSRLDFAIERQTWQAMLSTGKQLVHISKERIRDEWRKIIESDTALQGLRLLGEPGLLPFEEWRNLFATCSKNFHNNPILVYEKPAFRWAVLLALGRVEKSISLFTLWKFPKLLIQEIQSYLDIIFAPLPSDLEVKKLLAMHGLERTLEAFRIRSFIGWDGVQPDEGVLTQWDREFPIRSLKDLAIQGHDILQVMGKPPGPWLGKTLRYLYERVAFHGFPNNSDQLLLEARKVNEDEK
ncbi:MAG TPA: CCA tRNA nucleotidyltransferase [Bacillota bacterium]|nr:CCA tRNA nucleotidyltransferase [Bacillota bacterium]